MGSVDFPDELENLQASKPVFVSVSSHNLREFTNSFVKKVTEDGLLVIYIGITKPSSKVKGMLKDRGVDIQKILFFDMATKIAGSAPDRAQNTVFFKPGEINQVNMKLDDAVKSIPEGRDAVIVFDTVSTLSIYNDEDTILQFLNSLTAKMKNWEIDSLLIGVEEEMDEKLSASIKNATEKSIEISE
jgi:KaiC/GvpD/RAD55 family RecA-like ATPase